ncbi:MAG: cation:proton antiporter [Candidatus Dormibacteraeota bacterium]|uniref:Cation:proton antiporter n=1 Tax=Candidatus Dormiibacter inghamiae TaxID=3127013 RepID=A0A934KKH8_9BACT|nr:cation:proton antiporter [Candidatus Dormibacteraeota bacterium]MBJ7606899.1 cation:proton antiporter [Candidatus Dormibacteraeota bacterium]
MFTSLALLVLAGLTGPLLAGGKRQLAPVLVGELIAGAVLGRTGLHLLNPGTQPLPAFFSLGFAMLMLTAGTEVDLGSKDLRQGAPRAGLAVLVTLAASIPVGLAIGALLQVKPPQLFIVLLAGSSAAVAFPTIQERALTGPAVAMLLAWITLADAMTALVMPLTLTGVGRLPEAILGDALIVAVAAAAIFVGRRLFRTELADEAKRESKHRHWALQLRISVFLLLALAAIAEHTGASLLVAGFAAGIVLRQFHEPHRLVHQLTGLATGFFVPAFFVLLGATLDLNGLVRSPVAMALALTMAVTATAVHVLAAVVAGKERRVPAGLLASAQLGLPAAAAALGLASGALSPPLAAALVAGGCLTLIPATAGAMLLAARGSATEVASESAGGRSPESP